MKRLMLRIAPINRRRLAAAHGSVTLETALVMPVFLIFVLFLVFMIQTAIISMAFHGALSQTARQAASAWYPVSLGIEQAKETKVGQQAEKWNEKWLSVGETVGKYGKWLPSPMKEWAEQASNGSLSLEQQAVRLAFGQLMKPFVDENVLEDSRIRLTSVVLPDGDDRAQAYLTIEAEYKLPMKVPFIGRSLVLRSSARERVWIGGSPSASRLDKEGEGEAFEVSFVSLEPNPVRPGRKATLVIRTKPGTTVDLSIVYKSGLSQAKHLGSAMADGSGLVSWTWHVSGRTTPGQWNLQVANHSGGLWKRDFEVAGKKSAVTGEAEQ
ncbi:pilus assembly protein [Cohnella endophytica]|uniref:Pilus assembly protein n=1 Tax=Cohnella endophytica TaxID=2419778 RepID=A0A494Y050_9BACL|nr:TadE family protein [Cohnella endophytica]RKP53817.1 pilus assembly protein [Cohnella endophytica]